MENGHVAHLLCLLEHHSLGEIIGPVPHFPMICGAEPGKLAD